MMTMTGGEACVRVLKGAGVKTVFGLLGGSMLELYDALRAEPDVRYIGARDERAAGHMADAYARVTGGPGIVLGAQAGPGVANLVTAVAEAHLAYSPLVAIAGAITRKDLGKDTFQEFDQLSLFKPIAKRSIMVPTPERLPEMLAEAMHLAMSGRRGPVVLHAPRDLFPAEIDPPESATLTWAEPGAPTPEQVERIISLLAEAERPGQHADRPGQRARDMQHQRHLLALRHEPDAELGEHQSGQGRSDNPGQACAGLCSPHDTAAPVVRCGFAHQALHGRVVQPHCDGNQSK